MPKLFHTERGRVLAAYNEELTRWRWARKQFRLPAAAAGAPAELWLFIAPYDGSRLPLAVAVNGRKVGSVPPDVKGSHTWTWRSVAVPASRLKTGINNVVLRCEATEMTGWITS